MPAKPPIASPKSRLTIADYQRAAQMLSVPLAAVRAVTEVESGGAGFTPAGRCIIRFEPHLFSRRTNRLFDKSHPAFSFQPWRPGYPAGVTQSWELFQRAAALNAGAAVCSTSWGLFQVLGSNYVSSGCDSLGEFVSRMEKSEAEQLTMFCSLIDDWGLDDELRRQDWAGFARVYNGKQYKINKYDTKLGVAFAKYSAL